MDKETKLVKDRECIKCEKLFDCKGNHREYSVLQLCRERMSRRNKENGT